MSIPYAAVSPEAPISETMSREDRMRSVNEMKLPKEIPDGIRDLTASEAKELVEEATKGMEYFTKPTLAGGKGRFYYEDPSAKILAALVKANARYTDYEFDVSVLTTVQGRPAVPGIIPDDTCDPILLRRRDHIIAHPQASESDTNVRANNERDAWDLQSWWPNDAKRHFWIRVSSLGAGGVICGPDVSHNGMVQHGDTCDITAKIAAIAYSAPETIRTMFSPPKLTHYGMHTVRLCVDDRECYLIMDDYVVRDIKSVYYTSKGHAREKGEHWEGFIMKAMAKFHAGTAWNVNRYYRYNINECGEHRFGPFTSLLLGLKDFYVFKEGDMKIKHKEEDPMGGPSYTWTEVSLEKFHESNEKFNHCWSQDYIRYCTNDGKGGINNLGGGAHEFSILWSGKIKIGKCSAGRECIRLHRGRCVNSRGAATTIAHNSRRLWQVKATHFNMCMIIS